LEVAASEHVADDQHSDHQYWIDRRATDLGVARAPHKLGQIQQSPDLPNEMIVRNRLVEPKLAK
jgi:hypothetical protein